MRPPMSVPPRPLRISYLVEDTALSVGIRVQLMQADALIARGHQVRMVTKGLPLTWRSCDAAWVYLDNFYNYDASEDDVVGGTFWLTLHPAWEIARERAVHLCQGYEGFIGAYADRVDKIENAYHLPLPKLVVAPSLVEVCKRFTDDVTYIGQIVESDFFRDHTRRENEPLRVLVCGQAQADFRGIEDAYGAVAHARWFHQKLDLIRVSAWAPSEAGPVECVREFHVALNTHEMTRLMH